MLQFYPFFVWWAFHDCLMCYLLFIVLLVWRSDSIWIALTLWVILIFYVLVNNLIVLLCLLVMQIPLNYFLKGVLNVPKYISLLLVYNCCFAYLIERFLRFFTKYGTWRSQIWILEWCFLMLSKSLDLMFLGQALIFFSAHVYKQRICNVPNRSGQNMNLLVFHTMCWLPWGWILLHKPRIIKAFSA